MTTRRPATGKRRKVLMHNVESGFRVRAGDGLVRCQVVPMFNRRIFFGKSTPHR